MNKKRYKKTVLLLEAIKKARKEAEEISAEEWDALKGTPENLKGKKKAIDAEENIYIFSEIAETLYKIEKLFDEVKQ